MIWRKPISLSVASMTLILSGCGGVYTAKETDVTDHIRFLEPSASEEVYQSFASVDLSPTGVLSVSVIEQINAPEFEVPVLTTKQVDGVRANPIGASIAAVSTLGLYPLLLPKEFARNTFGYQSSHEVLKTNADFSQTRRTGRSEWVSFPYESASIKASVGSLAEAIDIEVDADGRGSLDLSEKLLWQIASGGGVVVVKVVCKNCSQNASGSSEFVSREIKFKPGKYWQTVADYYGSNDVLWVSLKDLFGEHGGKDKVLSVNSRGWRDYFDLVEMRRSSVLKLKEVLPADIYLDRYYLSSKIPELKVVVARNDYETTESFNQRVMLAKKKQDQDISDYNQKVESLNKRISEFKESVPKTLAVGEMASIMQSVLVEMVGEPEIKSSFYDPDVQRIYVNVGGGLSSEASDIKFSLISKDEINPDVARKLLGGIEAFRVFTRFKVEGQSLVPADAHLVSRDVVLQMRFVESVVAPSLNQVVVHEIEADDMKSIDRVLLDPFSEMVKSEKELKVSE